MKYVQQKDKEKGKKIPLFQGQCTPYLTSRQNGSKEYSYLFILVFYF